MQIAKALGGLQRREGRRPAQGDRQEEPRGDGASSSRSSARAAARPASTASVIDWLWATNEKSADYSLQQVPRRLLRADRLPHGVAAGQLPGRVHGGADLLGDGHEGQGPVLRRALRGRWGSRSCRRTSTSPTTSSSSSTGNIRFGLDAVKGVGFAAVEAIKAAREEDGPFESLWDFCERVDARAVNKRAIEALIKCGAFGSTGATRKGMLAVLEQAQAAGPAGPARRPDRPGLDLRPGRPRRRRASSRRGAAFRPGAPADPARGVRPARAAGRREGGDRPVRLRAPAQGGARGAARGGRRLARRAAAAQGRRVGHGRRHHHRRRRRSARRPATPMMFATLDDLEGAIELIVFEKTLAECEGALGGRRDRARARARRPQGQGQDLHRRPERRALRPDARGGRGRAREGGARAAGPAGAAPAPRRRATASRRRSSTTSSTCSATTRGRARSCST